MPNAARVDGYDRRHRKARLAGDEHIKRKSRRDDIGCGKKGLLRKKPDRRQRACSAKKHDARLGDAQRKKKGDAAAYEQRRKPDLCLRCARQHRKASRGHRRQSGQYNGKTEQKTNSNNR